MGPLQPIFISLMLQSWDQKTRCTHFFYFAQKLRLIMLELIASQAVTKGVLTGHAVAMATYCVTKIKTTCLSMIGHFFDTVIVASSDKEGL